MAAVYRTTRVRHPRVMKKALRYVSFVVDWTIRITAIGLMAFLVVGTFALMLWNRGSP